jgi:nucleotide-binding universal stress UspA family protein
MIVVGIDYSEESRHALRWARRHGEVTGFPVTAVHAGPPVYELVAHTPYAEERRAALLPDLDEFVAETGGAAVAREIVDGPAGRALVTYDADLVVVGRHGMGFVERAVIGSTADEVVHHARCPVVVVPRAAGTDVRRVVVGTDGSEGAAAAVRWAAATAVARRVRLVVLHAAHPPYDATALYGVMPSFDDHGAAEAFVEDAVAKVRADVGDAIPVEGVVARTGAVPALAGEVTDDDLLVVGSRGHGPVARALLGSTSTALVRQSRCAVVVVPHVS